MIGSLRGTVLEVMDGPQLLVEVAGVGYRVAVPVPVLAGVRIGGPVFLHVHTHVREDAIVLYGFADREARSCFEGLLAAHGVGPSLALAVLSVHTPAALRRAVLAGDASALTSVPGVGAKTAARLLLELEPRLGAAAEDGSSLPAGTPGGPLAEVRAALFGLGYGPEEVRTVMAVLPEQGRAEDLLRTALRELASSR